MKDHEKSGRPVDVKMLIALLSYLPPDALVYFANWKDTYPLDRCDLEPKMGPILVYERDGDVRLIIDTGEAYDPDMDPYTTSLFWAGGATSRASKKGKL